MSQSTADVLLVALVDQADKGETSIEIVLDFDYATVSGHLVGRNEYCRNVRSLILPEAGQPDGGATASLIPMPLSAWQDDEEAAGPGYIHLKSANIFRADQALGKPGWWRGRVADVRSFSVRERVQGTAN